MCNLLKIAMMASILLAIHPTNAMTRQPDNTDTMQNLSPAEMFARQDYRYDTFTTPGGRQVTIFFIKHGTLALDVDGCMVYVDPVGMFGTDFSALPKADVILVTHEHGDHFDADAINKLTKETTRVYTSKRVAELYDKALPLDVDTTLVAGNGLFSLTTVPAYNVTPDRLGFHPRERADLGFVVDVDGFRIYIAGDTEDIPEMQKLQNCVDVAFLPVNQPYTMTPSQALNAVEMIRPRVLYPYHYGQTDLTPIVTTLDGSDTEVRVRQME